MDFRLVTNPRNDWPVIRPMLAAVRAKNADEWIEEDIYHYLKSGLAAAHLAYDDDECCGLMVTMLQACEFSQKTAIHVLIAYNTGDKSVLDHGIELLKSMKDAAGAEEVTFESARSGWGRRFERVSTTYRIDI